MAPTEIIERIDQVFFMLINHDSDHKMLDPVMIALQNPFSWTPVYGYLAYFSFRKWGKNGWKVIGLSAATVLLTIGIAFLLETLVGRPGPSYNLDIKTHVKVLVGAVPKNSFPSMLATIQFGLAGLWYRIIQLMNARRWKWLWVWAGLICYAQVYVGAGYPIDVLFGALVGLIAGSLMIKPFRHIQNDSIRNLPIFKKIKNRELSENLQENPV
ncbi:MAG: phosphatase PAP2 family protein [Bacteroidota bacterium]|nr:phosphatase PAP2 family protein [Bacteroidota bacterium]